MCFVCGIKCEIVGDIKGIGYLVCMKFGKVVFGIGVGGRKIIVLMIRNV